jgi:arylsulfatase
MGEWKGLVTDVAAGKNKMKLFRINEDPREENDLSGQYPDVIKKMWTYIRQSHTPSAHPPFDLEITFPEK